MLEANRIETWCGRRVPVNVRLVAIIRHAKAYQINSILLKEHVALSRRQVYFYYSSDSRQWKYYLGVDSTMLRMR